MSEFNEILKETIKINEQLGRGGMEIQSFRDAGLMTNDTGLVVKLGTGEVFNITIDKDERHGESGINTVREFAALLEEAIYNMEEDFDEEDEPEDEAFETPSGDSFED